ncbi:major facilitator superfamily domain-containing protein, partial [Zopfochytrium polystomum]
MTAKGPFSSYPPSAAAAAPADKEEDADNIPMHQTAGRSWTPTSTTSSPSSTDVDLDGLVSPTTAANSRSPAQSAEASWQLLMLLLAVLPEAVTEAMLTPLAPYMVAQYYVSDPHHLIAPAEIGARAGAFSAAFYFPLLVMNVLWGAWSDRYGRKIILMAGLLVAAVSVLALGSTRSFYFAVACRVLAGVFGGNSTVAKGGLGELFQDSRGRAWAYAHYGSVYSIAGIAGPLLGGILTSSKASSTRDPDAPQPDSDIFTTHPFLLACGFAGALTLFCTFFVWRYLREPRELRLPTNAEKASAAKASTYARVRQDDGDDAYEDEDAATLATDSAADDGAAAKSLAADISSPTTGRKRLPNQSGKGGNAAGGGIFERGMRAFVGPLTASVVLPICFYMLIAFCNMAWVTALPLLHSSSVAAGGLALKPFYTSLAMTVIAVSKLTTQVLLYRHMAARLGVLGSYQLGMSLVIPPCILSGLMGGYEVNSFTWVGVFFSSIVLGVAEATSYL